ncbi:PGAM family member 5, mitochondrial serine/threonine protein phosphatase, partial [Chelydra serpentina]
PLLPLILPGQQGMRSAEKACPAPRPVQGGAVRGAGSAGSPPLPLKRCWAARGLHASALAMSFRRALALAACGLAGGSVLFSAVGVGKQPAPRGAGGDAETRSAGAAPGPGLLLLPPAAGSCPAAPGWAERPAGAGGYWDSNWDRREPLALINLKKKNEETGEEELASRLDHCKAKATRHIFLIRHSQYNLDGRIDKDRTLTQLGREQAELTGRRLASLGLKFDTIIHSSMTRATETTDIISKHLPGVKKISTDLLREGAPIEPVPPISHWKPEAVYYEDGARIE